jgi:cell division transport system permease protein
VKNLPFFIREAFAGFARGGIMTVAAVLSVAISMLIIGIFALVYFNLEGIYEDLRSQVVIDAYLTDEAVAGDAVGEIESHLTKLDGVAGVKYISKEAALEEFVGIFPSEKELLDYAGGEPLPASFRVTVDEDHQEPGSLAALADEIAAVDGVEDVSWGREWVQNLASTVRLVRTAGIVIGGILAIAAVLVVMSTVGLAVYARREHIGIMKVVGATDAFVNAPFIFEGALLGFVGGGLALGALWGAQAALAGEGAEISFLPGEYVLAFLGVAVVLGVVGAYISVKRFLRV